MSTSPSDAPDSAPAGTDRLWVGDWLLPGRSDAIALLVVWVARRSFWPVLWVGVMVAAAAGRLNDLEGDFDPTGDLPGSLLSPLAGVVVAIGLRAAASFAALVMGWLVVRAQVESRVPGRPRLSLRDQLFASRALRSVRWTHPVRTAALERADRAGGWLLVADRAVTVLNVVGFVVMLVVLALVVDAEAARGAFPGVLVPLGLLGFGAGPTGTGR